MSHTPLELQFDKERLRRYLQEHPDRAIELALNYREDFSLLATEYKFLEKENQGLRQENQALQSQLIKRRKSSPSAKLPDFLEKY